MQGTKYTIGVEKYGGWLFIVKIVKIRDIYTKYLYIKISWLFIVKIVKMRYIY